MPAPYEYAFNCPYCGDGISILLETFDAATAQNYIEDCEICCRPIEINYVSEESEITDFSARTTDE